MIRMHRSVFCAAIAALFVLPLVMPGFVCMAYEQIAADPELIASGAEFGRTHSVRAGDRFTVGGFDIGGFVETRNEPQFNQGVLPNHNWRGFVSALYSFPIIRDMQFSTILFTGIEHESSHATMGIVEETRDPYAMIYDHKYRKHSINGIQFGAQLVMFDQVNRLALQARGILYFCSKNTPELPGLDLTQSGGMSLGGVYRHLFGRRIGCFVSAHGRLIFRGSAERSEEVYVEDGDGMALRRLSYPIMNRIGTVNLQAGLTMPLFEARRFFDVYVKYLYGNIYGYVDSRDKRHVVALGMIFRGM